MLRRNTCFAVAMVLALSFCAGCRGGNRLSSESGQIPVQHEGRIKSLDVFSREILQFVSGRTHWQGRPAAEIFLDGASGKNDLLSREIIRLDHKPLKHYLDVSGDAKYFSYRELKPLFPALITLVDAAQQKRDADQRPSALEQKAELLYQRLMLLDRLHGGELWRVIPVSGSPDWQTPDPADGELSARFLPMLKLYAQGDESFGRAAEDWQKAVIAAAGDAWVLPLRLENFYYGIKPFHYAAYLYIAAFLVLCFWNGRRGGRVAGLGLLTAGGAFHTLGLALRVLILSRPPVSNMYESMIFMNWILILCALVLYARRRKLFLLSTASLVSALVMIYADLLPIESSLGVLAPVLRSSYWLIIHVMTIVASYGVFGLAMALGHRHLFLNAVGKLNQDDQSASAQVLLQLIQLGVLTLGVGTVLGGVWANESWGRFWGWDPKETWALITFLGYLAVIHLRYARKLSDQALAVCAVLGFLLVLMTWYGVNFLLGRGLHSYGSGSGGAVWIAGYLVFEALFFVFVMVKNIGRPVSLGHGSPG